MFIDKWNALYQAPEEVGADITPEVTPTPDTTPEPEAGPGSGRSSIRKSLEKGFEDTRKAADEAAKSQSKGKKAAGTRRVAGGAEIEAPEAAGAPETDAETPETGTPETPTVAAPESLSKEAKAKWAETPAEVQAAFVKRESDMAKGVEELKTKYKDLDSALAPHMQVIRQNGHTPAAAVSQLFAWMQALGGNPDVAFPALAKSFGYDLARFAPKQPAAAAPAVDPAAAAAAQPAAVAPEVQQYINDMKKQIDDLRNVVGTELGTVKSAFQRESEEKTNAVLANWSQGKTHFEAVRGLMAHFIQSGAVPLKNGQVDLDGAYDMAVFANPEVRAKVLAEQQVAQEAERKKKAVEAQKKAQEAADKARKAGVSLSGNAPGEGAAPAKGTRGKGKSVRDSIMEAREQLTE